MKDLACPSLLLLAYVSLLNASQSDWQARIIEANRLDREGRYGEAGSLYAAALSEAQKPPVSHRWLAESLNNLAAHYFYAGKYAEAEPLYLRSIEEWKAAGDGARHDLASTLNNLALLYRVQARYAEAEPLYLRAAPLLEPVTGGIWNKLAELYLAEGKYEKSEEAARRSLRSSSETRVPIASSPRRR
jgi:tetratricopeptide (TPR) repeat protein